MSELGCESRIVGTPSRGRVLEIAFHGTHDSTHAAVMNRYIREKLAELAPAAIVFNLLDYRYVFGNDLTGLFTASFDRDAKGLQIRPVCIVSTGRTHTSLHNLFRNAKLMDAPFKIEFLATVDSALQHLTERLRESA